MRVLGTYETETGVYSEPLELLSAIYNGETRPVLLPRPEQDLGQHLPYSRVSFGLDALEVRGPSQRGFASILGIKEYPDASRAGLLDSLLRVPHELVVTESFAPIERQTARERIDLSLRRLKSADEGAATERAEMLAARDAVGAGQLSFGDHHLSLLVRSELARDARERDRRRSGGACRHWRCRGARGRRTSSRPSGDSSPERAICRSPGAYL